MNGRTTTAHYHRWALIAYLALTGVMTWPLTRELTTAIPGDSFDGWQNYWNLWWLKVALVERGQNPFVTDLLFHPTGVNLYFHTLNPFNGLVTMPIQLTLGLIPAYNAVVFLSWVLGGYGTYLLTLWVLTEQPTRGDRQVDRLRTHLAAFIAGVIFTFAPFHMAHLLGHMQVMALQWLPFYVLHLLRALSAVDRKAAWLRDASLAGLFLSLAGLCDWYFVLYLVLFTALALLAVFSRRLTSAPHAPRLTLLAPFLPPLLAGLIFALALAPILWPMVQEALHFSFMVRPASDLYIFSASVSDFFTPNRLHPLVRPGGWVAEQLGLHSYEWIGNQVAPPSERTISIGCVALLLALVGLWWDRRRSGFWLVCAGGFLLLALGPRPHWANITPADIPATNVVIEQWTPYALLNRLIPFMRISRSVSRYAVIVQLAIAVAAAIGQAALWRRLHAQRTLWSLAALSGLLILGEFWVAPYPLSPPDTPAFYTELAAMDTAGAVLNLPMNYDRPGYLLYQTVHQKPLTVGYISRDDPRTLTERIPVLQHFRRLGPDILADDPAFVGFTVLQDLGVDFVILDRYKMPGGLERDYTEQLAAAIFAGQTPRYADERITVFAAPTSASPVPYLLLGETNWGALQSTGEIRSRALGDQPARVYVRHAPPAAKLFVRYHMTGPATLIVAHVDSGRVLATWPAAPQSQRAQLDLTELPPDRFGDLTLAFSASTPQAVHIELLQLALE